MDYTVEFDNLITNISINPLIKHPRVQFLYRDDWVSDHSAVNPQTKQRYPVVRGMKVHCHLDKPPRKNRQVQEELEVALDVAEEIITGLVATTQGYCFLPRPIICTYNGSKYALEEGSWWGEISSDDLDSVLLRDGGYFVDDLSFLDNEKTSFHPMYHFYRAAKDESSTYDFRALNAWRFLEAFYGKADSNLKKHLIKVVGWQSATVNSFYDDIRCAVAHAQFIKSNPATDKVILPRSYETQFNGDVWGGLEDIMDIIDKLVRSENPEPIDTIQR
jgi:hypothetical protein